jgi:hypothetical protein
MGRVITLLETTTVTAAGDTAGDQHNCQMVDDEGGAVQFLITAGTCTEIELQGRLHPDMGWVELATSGALSSAGTSEVLQTGVAILPQMRAVMKGATGASVLVGLME